MGNCITSGAEIARQIENEEGVTYTRAGIKKIIGRSMTKMYVALKRQRAGTPIEIFIAMAQFFNVHDVDGYKVMLRDFSEKHKNEIINEFREKCPSYIGTIET